MIQEKIKRIINREQSKKQAIITITAAVDVDVNSYESVERQAARAVLKADSEIDSIDGLEFEEVIEVRAHE
ncbi:hypothetical protein [Salinicoccus sp. Marseille-QA3877]